MGTCNVSTACDCFRSDLNRLRSAVTNARSKASTQRNQTLLPTEDELNKLSYNLSVAVSEVLLSIFSAVTSLYGSDVLCLQCMLV